jgi:subtilisin-like proprotein convertase family protein
LLNINTDYFWRVKQINLCGSASYTSAGKFKTVNLECGVQTYSGSPIAIADVANTLVTSTMAFNNPNITSIYDLDVSLNLTHTYVQDMTISLVSPSGTTVILQEEACGSQNDINVVYDDSGNNIVCGSVSPAISGRVKSFQVLSALNGQNPNGNWQLIVDDPYNNDGGFINSWTLNICKIVPLSASDFDKNKFKIYPNPTNNSVSVFFEDLQITGYVVYDIQGREILIENKQFNASFDIDLSRFNSGIYLLKIATDKGDFTQKVIKN